jgi:uncharacterized protein (DUF2225 family)
MLAIKYNEDGYILSVAEYRIVDDKGNPDEKGIYCYIKEYWVHPKHQNKNLIKEMIKKEHIKYPKVKYVYWKRTKYGGRMRVYKIKEMYAVKE